MKLSKKILLYLSVFITGACIMVFEIITPRIYAPFFGTSTYVWTGVIGVVLGSLSLGYFLGGQLTNRKVSISFIGFLILSSGILIYLTALFKDIVIMEILFPMRNPIYSSIIASLIFLAPVGIVLGSIIPLTVHLLTPPKTGLGKNAGNVYAISTLGSIFGTFFSGFWLIPNFGIHNILLGIAVALIICAMILFSSRYLKIILLITMPLLVYFYGLINPKQIFANIYKDRRGSDIIADMDTKYQRVWVHDQKLDNSLVLRTLSNSQSEITIDITNNSTNPEKNLGYFSFFDKAFEYNKNIRDILIIGGGAYVYISNVNKAHPDINIDVVEIDPELLGVAQKYFIFKPFPNFTNYTEDGRMFLNQNSKKYDAIFIDAYLNGDTIPFQLVTKQAYELMNNSLTSEGMAFVNLLSSIDGKRSKLFKSQFNTMSVVFDEIKTLTVESDNPYLYQSIVLVGFKRNSRIPSNVFNDGIILTDDYAPVEYFDLKKFL